MGINRTMLDADFHYQNKRQSVTFFCISLFSFVQWENYRCRICPSHVSISEHFRFVERLGFVAKSTALAGGSSPQCNITPLVYNMNKPVGCDRTCTDGLLPRAREFEMTNDDDDDDDGDNNSSATLVPIIARPKLQLHNILVRPHHHNIHFMYPFTKQKKDAPAKTIL